MRENEKGSIVIIDSGIDIKNERLMKNVVGGIGFRYNQKGKIQQVEDFQDTNGHGTACAQIIQNANFDNKMFIIKILNENAEARSEVLLRALEYTKQLESRIINISLATDREEYKSDYEKICKELKKKGKIMISSFANRNSVISLPATLSDVIGVRGQWITNGDYWFNSKYEIQCVSSLVPQCVIGINGNYTLFGGNSKAAAQMSAVVSRLLSNTLSIQDMEEKLTDEASKNVWIENDINNCIPLLIGETERSNKINPNTLSRIKDVVEECFNVENRDLLEKYTLLHEKIGMNSKNWIKLIFKLEENFDINFNYSQLNLENISSIYHLYDLIVR